VWTVKKNGRKANVDNKTSRTRGAQQDDKADGQKWRRRRRRRRRRRKVGEVSRRHGASGYLCLFSTV